MAVPHFFPIISQTVGFSKKNYWTSKVCFDFLYDCSETFLILNRFQRDIIIVRGPGSSVGIATELRAGRSGDRIPVGRDFPPVQTGPGAHPASCKMGTGSFQGVKSGRGVLLTTNRLLVPRSWKRRAIPLPTLWATTGPVTGTLPIIIGHTNSYNIYICFSQTHQLL